MVEKNLVEAALFVATDPVKPGKIAKTIGTPDEKQVKTYLDEIAEEYKKRDGGVVIEKSKAGYMMKIKKDYEPILLGMIPETDLSKSMLKTLALIAYEQPVKQSYVIKIRGTRAYYYIKKLTELELIQGKEEGHTKMLSTTGKFKDYFSLKDNRISVK